MKKQYSFKTHSRASKDSKELQNIPPKEIEFSTNRISRNAWTDLKVEEIKKKYDTPSHKRRNGSSFGFNDKPSQFRLSLQRNTNTSFTYSNFKPLRETNRTNRTNRIKTDTSQIRRDSLERNYDGHKNYQEEQAEKTVFDRIDQMKNYILSQGKGKQLNFHKKDYKKGRDVPQINSRVDNIDKINEKIKKILDCLHEGEHFRNQREPFDKSFIRNSLISNEPSDNFQYTKILSGKQISQNKVYSTKLDSFCFKKSKLINESRSILKENNSPSREPRSSWFKNSCIEKNRSKSCLDESINETLNGKNIDQEISKINTRIKQFQEEKRKLNIQFKPFNYKATAKSNTPLKSQRVDKPPLPSRSKLFENSKHMRCKTDFIPILDAQKQSQEEDKFPTILSQKSKGAESKVSSMKQSKVEDENLKQIEELKLKTDEGIETRKKKLLQTATITFAKETKRLIEELFEQVKLDENYRHSKIWFRDAMIQNRWEKLLKAHNSQGEEISMQELMKEYSVCQEEDNPFFSVRQCQTTIQNLVQNQVKANQHWKAKIFHKFSLKQFEKQKFTSEKVDMERKGYFIVQDLVRFLNMETGTFYRNRDLYLVFRRLTEGEKMNFSNFLDLLQD